MQTFKKQGILMFRHQSLSTWYAPCFWDDIVLETFNRGFKPNF